ncbi:hypothetical protein ABZ783_07170 [Micromonospora sp. NPDC047738]|uniref:hypothetical protein n=1 Tax=Micromonospora sp. NPDC047738 TaxID=3155741 RepID=UPI0033FA72AB
MEKIPDRRLIRRLRFEIGVLAVVGTALIAAAVWWTATVATGQQHGALAVVLVAVFAAEAMFGCFGMVIGIGDCRNQIRQARR